VARRLKLLNVFWHVHHGLVLIQVCASLRKAIFGVIQEIHAFVIFNKSDSDILVIHGFQFH